ncbi:hypothetical protein BDA99DRAFT_534001 [Phascolomyces articulosus]|uniref:Uncharacterized protein n=1 Tax=Phascolomyces articulosus TaxID=60185 RepID=A0AAD5K661_9FUNG|nr:hypothetical protein BDA99DRAFT_534001 [Phascolomyces articulosus]
MGHPPISHDLKLCINNASTLSVQNFIEAFNYGDKAATNTRYSAILRTKTYQTNVPNISQLKQEFEQWKKSQQEQTCWNNIMLRSTRQTTETNLRVAAAGAVGRLGVEEGQTQLVSK